MLFKCTLKVRKALKLGDRDLSVADNTASDSLNTWYCNLFFMNRRKCLLWTHERALFNVLALDVRQADFNRFGEMFRSHLLEVLRDTENVSQADINRLVDDGPDYFAKTDNRAVLGSMNDHVFMCKDHSACNGFENLNFMKLSKYLNRVPMGYMAYNSGSEGLRQLLGIENWMDRSLWTL